MPNSRSSSRRRFLHLGSAVLGGAAVPSWVTAQGAPALVASDGARPRVLQGLQLGDPSHDSLLVWSRSDRPARMVVEWSLDRHFRQATRVVGPYALADRDFTVRQDLTGLPADREVFVRVSFQALDSARTVSEPVTGRLVTLPAGRHGSEGLHRGGRHAADLRFVWGGDTAGQGWGINPAFGGMRIYEAMRVREPRFFIHSGDSIYADGPIQPVVQAENGQTWQNIVTPEVSKVAETLDEFRGRYRYNLLDENVRRFNAEVPQIWQWDDHEVTNNWSDAKDLSADTRYTEKSVPLLTARGTRAFLDYAPLRPFDARESQRVYRRFSYGPLLDVFVIDMRSYRGPNTDNLQPVSGAQTAFLGREQLEWLKDGLDRSRALWKVIAADMPIGLNIGDGTTAAGASRWEAVANGNAAAPLGRELEVAELLRFIRRRQVRNTVWLTADVHYCAAHYYDPQRAAFDDFDGFWEFVAGPLNAGSFGPNTLDGTFGPQLMFFKAPPAGQANLSPYAGLQFFGEVNLDGRSGALTVDMRDLDGASVYSKTLAPRFG
ncbi:alkaline phosphatase D family protein [Schlegelella sp. S2-27]|uniref:Alkaline phosphatase D family protein n=1 Tax=Caldimonas mangrovi TaxID=2944811 RepID=A0ABT0YQ96_9BURK|nr:alkaline phosphatase D family protein [Caldimonas mangrovi]MCM5680028.1 alkaline phosphatase D family protein [Caldimonas mangrovi]